MIAAEQWGPPTPEWTTDDLDALPEDGIRRELIDGVLIVAPAPSIEHQTLAMMLGAKLAQSRPSDYLVTQAVEVRVNPKRTFIPDLVIVGSEAAQRRPRFYSPQEVALVAEIVSPSTRTFDRVTKPNLYAEAGIPFFWRVELEPQLVINTYKLSTSGGGAIAYRQTGAFDDVLEVTEPWPMSFDVPELLPHELR